MNHHSGSLQNRIAELEKELAGLEEARR